MHRFPRFISVCIVMSGAVLSTAGAWLESQSARTNLADDIAWGLLALGVFLIGLGCSLFFTKAIPAIAIGLALPAIGWVVLVAGYWGLLMLNRWPTQQQMAPSGYALIPAAREIDDYFGPAWHELSNYQEPDRCEWQTEALFGGRYDLEMTVAVRVDRRAGRVVEVTGKPHFHLREIESTDGNGMQFNTSAQVDFGGDQWREIVDAGGNFSAIGVQLKEGPPLAGFDRLKASAHNGVQLRRRRS